MSREIEVVGDSYLGIEDFSTSQVLGYSDNKDVPNNQVKIPYTI
jgi:hypothetical protein